MKNYLRNWNFMRLLRLALGIYIIVYGIQLSQWWFIVIGAYFTLMPLLNIGCCGSNSCKTPYVKGNNKSEDITYDEIH